MIRTLNAWRALARKVARDHPRETGVESFAVAMVSTAVLIGVADLASAVMS